MEPRRGGGRCGVKIGIMQPYFAPYLGYWQLLATVDTFVVYDNIQYTKKGWINRNRYLQRDGDSLFTIPVKRDSDYLDVGSRAVAEDFDRDNLLNRLEASYRKAPFFNSAFPVIISIIRREQRNLFEYILHSMHAIAEFLDIKTPIVVSSTVSCDHSLRSEARVIAICQAFGATTYINPIGGQALYSQSTFTAKGIALKFLKTRSICYPQYGAPFVPNLSIIDVMMFNSKDSMCSMLTEYDLI